MGRLVGRDAEIAALEAMQEEARAGRGAVALVEGAPGVGKTRLVEELAARAARAGVRVGWGRAWELGGAPPFWPWTQALRTVREGRSVQPSAELARILPELGESAQSAQSAEERFVVFDEALRFLVAAAEERPLLIVLEDLHAADAGSFELLLFVASHLRDARVLIVATLRASDSAHRIGPGPIEERARRSARVVSLGPLALEHVTVLARDTPGVTLSAETIERLHATTEGYPLYVTEVLRILARGWDGHVLPVPGGARAILRERLSELPSSTRALLSAASVIGRDVRLPLLAAVSGRTVDDASRELAAARELGLIEEMPSGRLRFSHALFAEALRAELSPERCESLHTSVADELERLHAEDPAAPVAEIAHHLLAAGPAVAPRAIPYAQRAAEAAMQKLAFEEAIDVLERARAKCDLVSPPDGLSRAKILVAIGRARALAGDPEGARAACLEAADIARALRSVELVAEAALALGAALTVGATDLGLVALLREALRDLGGEPSALRAQVLARLAAALQPARAPEQPMALAREAIAMSRDTGDERARLEVLHLASAGLAKFAPPDERLAIDLEAAQRAEELRVPSLALRAHARLVFDCMELGDVHAARLHVASYEAIARARPRPDNVWPVPMFRAMLALYEGRLAEHAEVLADARAAVMESGDAIAALCLEMHAIGVLRTVGDDAALEGRTSTLWRRSDGPYDLYDRTLRAMVLARTERTADLAALLARHDPTELVAQQDLTLAVWAAEATARARDRRWAEALLGWLRPMPERVALQAMHGMFVEGPVARALFLLADVVDDEAPARGWLEATLAHARSRGARPLEARASYEWGCIRAARGDEAEARRYLESAREIAVSLGLRLADAIERASEALGPSAPSSPTSGDDGALALVRDGDGWSLSGLGAALRLGPSRGLEMLSRLIAMPGREVHCLDLTDAAPGGDAGDAGEVIDRAARDAYRARLRELGAELAEAQGWNDAGRTEQLRAEVEALEAELARGVGLSGRPRRAGSASERARINARRRIAAAIEQIRRHHADLGEHLSRCVRTGAFCSYDPARGDR